MCCPIILLLFIFFTSVNCLSPSSIVINCNFKEFERGCVDEEGSQCDANTNQCVCKTDYSIRLKEFCLQPKYIGDKCFTSIQCNHISNAGCYNYREEYTSDPSAFFGQIQKNWPSGTCRCKIGHHFEKETNACVKKTIGSWCSNVWDCRHSGSANTICEENVCKCGPDYFYNTTTQQCDFRETFGLPCKQQKDCSSPMVCVNKTCSCDIKHHFVEKKTPYCQPNQNQFEISRNESEEFFQIVNGDKSFEIFIITAIPLIILFLTIKPCWKKFVKKCKTPPEQIICGSKEIKINNSSFKENLASHYFCQERLQTIEELNEEGRDKEEIVISFDENQTAEKSIGENQVEANGNEKTGLNQSSHTKQEQDSCASSSSSDIQLSSNDEAK